MNNLLTINLNLDTCTFLARNYLSEKRSYKKITEWIKVQSLDIVYPILNDVVHMVNSVKYLFLKLKLNIHSFKYLIVCAELIKGRLVETFRLVNF